MAGPESNRKLAAGLTLYRPERVIFDALLQRVLTETAHVFVAVDGVEGEAIEAEHLQALLALPAVTVLPLRPNAGIATGLNRLVAAARNAGHGRLILFDQDSEPGAGLVTRLGEGMDTLKNAGHQPAALGPTPEAAPGSSTRAPRYRRRQVRLGNLQNVDFAIVSGSLLDLAAFNVVGPFRETLRMDGVDLEWGFRAWAHKRSIWVDEGVSLPHRVGIGLVRLGPIVFPRQSEARMVNYVRSQATCLRLAHIPLRWKLRTLVYVPLQIAAFALRSSRPGRTFVRLVRAAASGLCASLPRPSEA